MEKYRKIKVVGNGSFGHAVLVQSVQDKKLQIMKIIDVSKMDRKQKEEALNEVHVLKAMRHPYIVTQRESFMDKRCLCIVMDYADGGDMFKKIAKQKQLGTGFPESQVLDWFVQISLAIKHIHDRKILHRDLKTQNIFLNQKLEVKMGDFGIARVLQHTYDCAQTAIGTPYQLSPEICQEQPYNQKSDVWSLGCILQEMVTLKHAFDANSMKGLVLKILRGSYPPIPDMQSKEMRDLIAEMLNKDPKKRPSVKRILEKDFLAERIANLIPMSIVKQELGQTFVKDHVNKGKETTESISSQGHSHSTSASSSVLNSRRDSKDKQERNERMDMREPKLTQESNKEEEERVARVLSRKSSNKVLPKEGDVLANKDININLSRNEPIQSSRRPGSKEVQRTPSNPSGVLQLDKENAERKQRQEANDKLREKDRSHQASNSSIVEAKSMQQEEGQEDLLSSIKDVLHRNKNIELKDDDQGAETADQRTFQTFLSPEGKKIEFEGLDERDSMFMRIEALRMQLEKSITDLLFCKAYHLLSDPSYDDEDNSELQKMMGSKNKQIPLVYQLIVCEDQQFTNK